MNKTILLTLAVAFLAVSSAAEVDGGQCEACDAYGDSYCCGTYECDGYDTTYVNYCFYTEYADEGYGGCSYSCDSNASLLSFAGASLLALCALFY